MKKRFQYVILLLLSAILLTACQCQHDWVEADCTTAKTCTRCDEVVGEPLGHSWIAANCTTAKTCSACGRTEGTPAKHKWTEATCTEASVCNLCGEEKGEPLGHDWIGAVNRSGIEGRICTVCELVQMDTVSWTPLTDCERIAVSNKESHQKDMVVGDWDSRAGKLPDSIRFCVSNKESYRNTHYCIYKLDKNYEWLSALVSWSDKSEQFATAKIHVYLDNELAYESDVFSENSNDFTFYVDVSGVELVRIVCSTTDMPSAYCVVSASVY